MSNVPQDEGSGEVLERCASTPAGIEPCSEISSRVIGIALGASMGADTAALEAATTRIARVHLAELKAERESRS